MTTRNDAIIEFANWLLSPPGRYLLAWEQVRIDQAVADMFGYHALQLGLPRGRRACAPTACRTAGWPDSLWCRERVELPAPLEPIKAQSPNVPLALHCDFAALAVRASSLDLVVLPHALELSATRTRRCARSSACWCPKGGW